MIFGYFLLFFRPRGEPQMSAICSLFYYLVPPPELKDTCIQLQSALQICQIFVFLLHFRHCVFHCLSFLSCMGSWKTNLLREAVNSCWTHYQALLRIGWFLATCNALLQFTTLKWNNVFKVHKYMMQTCTPKIHTWVKCFYCWKSIYFTYLS